MRETLYGKNAVCEALRANRRRHRRLLIARGLKEKETLGTIVNLASSIGIPVERVERRVIDKQLPQVNHQGIALETGAYPYTDIEACLSRAGEQQVLLLMLDHIQDPQNIGTLLRTAEVVGVHGVLLPERRSATITPSVVNTSSGASEHLPIVLVGNLAQAISTLQDRGVWVVGVENDARSEAFDEASLDFPLALVVGAEGSGLARLTRDRCDFLVNLPMSGQVTSLNAAVAASIVLYHIWRQRRDVSSASES